MRNIEDSPRSGLCRSGGAARIRSVARAIPALLAAFLAVFLPERAFAQLYDLPPTVSEEVLAILSPKPRGGVDPFKRPAQEYRGLPVGDLIFYPTLYAGAIYDDNLTWSSRQRISAFGARVNPSLVVLRDTGIHKTVVFGDLDARYYPSLSRSDTIAGKAGFTHTWEIERDFELKTKLQFSRKANYVEGGSVETPTGLLTTLTYPLMANQLLGSVSLNKSFGRLFVGGSVETVRTMYDSLRTSAGRVSQHYRDSQVTTASFRTGVWFSPVLYAFSEAVGNIREYSDNSYLSRGYRLIAGIGSDRISLFRGEVFAGIQKQVYDQPLIQDAVTPVIGGKIYWYPTRALTFRATLDQSFTDSSTPSIANPNGLPARLTTAQFDVRYHMAKDWSANLRTSYTYHSFLGSSRRDQTWRAGVTFNYEVYRNLALSVDYEFARMISNTVGTGYNRNAVMFGLTYRY